jgi:hypothetical protein
MEALDRSRLTPFEKVLSAVRQQILEVIESPHSPLLARRSIDRHNGGGEVSRRWRQFLSRFRGTTFGSAPPLGPFEFERKLGWKTQIALGGKHADLVLGSDGEPPSDEMLRTAKWWLHNWSSQQSKIIEYARRELRFNDWSHEPNLPEPEKLEVESVNILWRDTPTTTIIYFSYPGDDLRAWHVTFEGFEPRSFAYDD